MSLSRANPVTRIAGGTQGQPGLFPQHPLDLLFAADRFPKIDPRAKTAVTVKVAGAGREGQRISPSLFTSNSPWVAAHGRIEEEWWAIEDLNL